MKVLPKEMRTIPALFNLIKEHTITIVDSDIKYWESKTEYSGADDYIDNMRRILKKAKGCKEGECVMRVGQASGWRFITGAWTENLPNFNRIVVPKSRPHNERYNQYDFPKTRRIDDQKGLFGFVKLSIIGNN